MKLRGTFCLLCALLASDATAQAQQWDWVQRFSGDGTAGTAVGVDDAQNVCVAGTFKGTNYIGTNQFTRNTNDNVFLAKFDPLGMPLWTTTASGSLTKMLVASNGSVFVCGSLSFTNPAIGSSISNVSIARMDEGNLTWVEALPENVAGASMAFGPDETIYVLGATNQAFVRRYTQGGLLLDSTLIQREPFTPLAITIGPHEEIYVMGRYATNWPYIVDFTTLISPSGEVIWTWTPGASAYNWDYHIVGIAATPDGGVVSIGFHSTWLPNKSAFVVKHSVTGTQEWVTGVSGYFKSFYSADGVTVGGQGKIYVTGFAAGRGGSYYSAERLLVLTLSPTGEHLSDERIASYVKGHANSGKAIAVDKDGAVIVTGTLQGQTIFGTNKLSYGAGGFVARRSTLFPELVQEQVGNDVVLSWPSSAFPVALQQSSDGENWMFVNVPPQRNGWRNQNTLPFVPGLAFRLFRTNETAILHPPRIFRLDVPGVSFLDHPKVVIVGTNDAPSAFITAYFDDEDENTLSVTWTNVQSGTALTNGISVARYSGRDEWSYRYSAYYGASVALDASIFMPGRHSVAVSVSDGTFTVTQNYPAFEVISAETAVQEFLNAIEPLRRERAGRQALEFLDAYRRAAARGHNRLAEKRWLRFQRHLQRITSLSEEEHARLHSAAEQVKSLL
jgi:hypothetical protein